MIEVLEIRDATKEEIMEYTEKQEQAEKNANDKRNV